MRFDPGQGKTHAGIEAHFRLLTRSGKSGAEILNERRYPEYQEGNDKQPNDAHSHRHAD
jgi:hypothetical protein